MDNGEHILLANQGSIVIDRVPVNTTSKYCMTISIKSFFANVLAASDVAE